MNNNKFIKLKEKYIGIGLTLAEILITCKIEQFTDNGKTCFMTDEQFAQLTQQSIRQTQRTIAHLEKMHVITRVTKSTANNGCQSRTRTITVNDFATWQLKGNDMGDVTLAEGNDMDDVMVTTNATKGNDKCDIKGNDMGDAILYNSSSVLLDKEKESIITQESRQTDKKDKTQECKSIEYDDIDDWNCSDDTSYEWDDESIATCESLQFIQRASGARRTIYDLNKTELQALVDDFARQKRYNDIREDYWLQEHVTLYTIREAEDLLANFRK